jgi:hypothetical protein
MLVKAVNMLADVSHVETENNNSMISILFVCIIHTAHIILILHRFFASYTNEKHVQSR